MTKQITNDIQKLGNTTKLYSNALKAFVENKKIVEPHFEKIITRILLEVSLGTDDEIIKKKTDIISQNDYFKQYLDYLTCIMFSLYGYEYLNEDYKSIYNTEIFKNDRNKIDEFEEYIRAAANDKKNGSLEYFFDVLYNDVCFNNNIIAKMIAENLSNRYNYFKEIYEKIKTNEKRNSFESLKIINVYSYISDFKNGLNERPAIIPGWDEPYNLSLLSEIKNTSSNEDHNYFFQAIRGRTRTRYGFQRKKDFNQGPHTIARVFGFNSRRIFLRDTAIKGRKQKGEKNYTFNLVNEKVKGLNENFKHLILTKDDIEKYKNLFPSIEKESYSYDFEELKESSMDEESNDYILKQKEIGQTTIRLKYRKFNYWVHLENTIKKYLDATSENNLIQMLIYGQILSDLHPFATSFNINADEDALAGGGESSTFFKIKWLSRLKINNPHNNLIINTKINTTNFKMRTLNDEEARSKTLEQVNAINCEFLEEDKLHKALELILPLTGSANKGLVDDADFRFVDDSLKNDFIKFIINSIHANLTILGFQSNLQKIKEKVESKYNYKTT